MTARSVGRNVKVTVQTAGEFEHLAYQADDLYTLEI
ncbi:MAG: hypothetical protein ACMUHY_09285, partial [Thermoplasmatota archaeon]